MLDLQSYVIFLLIIASVGMFYITRVIRKQIKLFKITEEPIIQGFRRKLFILSMVIVLFSLVPITINILTLFVDLGRPPKVPFISVVYTAGVHLQSLLLSYVLWRIYRLADEQEEAIHQLELKHLQSEEAKKKK